MNVINLDEIKQPVAKQVQFGKTIYNLINDADLDDLIDQMRNEQARVLGEHKSIVKTADKIDKLQNSSALKMIDFYNQNAAEVLKDSKAVSAEMGEVYIDFFNNALLDQDDNMCGAGKKLKNFFNGSTTMLATFYNKIASMREQEQSEADKQFDEVTDSALKKAKKVKDE